MVKLVKIDVACVSEWYEATPPNAAAGFLPRRRRFWYKTAACITEGNIPGEEVNGGEGSGAERREYSTDSSPPNSSQKCGPSSRRSQEMERRNDLHQSVTRMERLSDHGPSQITTREIGEKSTLLNS